VTGFESNLAELLGSLGALEDGLALTAHNAQLHHFLTDWV